MSETTFVDSRLSLPPATQATISQETVVPVTGPRPKPKPAGATAKPKPAQAKGKGKATSTSATAKYKGKGNGKSPRRHPWMDDEAEEASDIDEPDDNNSDLELELAQEFDDDIIDEDCDDDDDVNPRFWMSNYDKVPWGNNNANHNRIVLTHITSTTIPDKAGGDTFQA